MKIYANDVVEQHLRIGLLKRGKPPACKNQNKMGSLKYRILDDDY